MGKNCIMIERGRDIIDISGTKSKSTGSKCSIKNNKPSKKAFTLIEILIDFFVISLISLAILSAYVYSMKSMLSAKARIAAVSLANEKMEIIRNMPYDSLGTVGGWPKGELLDKETVIKNGANLDVYIRISTVDDPYDGCADKDEPGPPSKCLQNMDPAKPKDLSPYDYKRAEIIVTRKDQSAEYAKLSSYIAANAAETESNTGILKICVDDSEGQPLAGAKISIENTEVTPAVNIVDLLSGSDGCYLVTNLPPDSHNHYNVVVTKDGYTTEMTYERTSQNPNALQPDLSVYIQQITYQKFVIDKLSSMTITLLDDFGQPIIDTQVHIEGEKEIYFNPQTKKYSEDHTTNSIGQIILQNMEFDNYAFTVSGWQIISTSPYQPTYLPADEDLSILISASQDSSFPTISSCAPNSGVSGQTVILSITGSNFQENLTVKIVDENNNEISGQNISISRDGVEIVSAEFDLSGAILGKWDIVISNPSGSSVTQVDGLEVVVE